MDALSMNNQSQRAIDKITESLLESGADPQEVARISEALARRPLLRFFVLRQIEREYLAVSGQGRIDWDAIGDFLVKIAPIIIELIKLFM